jgi:NADH:ubiquinone oxidoreductase subunit 2 (subunit N)
VPQTKLVVILVLTSLVSAGYYLYVVMVMFMRPRKADALPIARTGGWTKFVIAAAAVLILVLGVLPNSVVRWTQRSSSVPPVAASATAQLTPVSNPR